MKTKRWDVLEGMIKSHAWTCGVELGVLKGDNYFRLLERCPDLTLVGVDTWKRTPAPSFKDIDMGHKDWTDTPMEEYERSVMKRARAFGSRARLIKSTSVAASSFYSEGTFDFVFVDADHKTQSVINDITAWAPKLKSDGWMIGHDAGWPSVRRAIDELCPHWIGHADSVWSAPKGYIVL